MCHCFQSSYCATAITKSYSTSVGAIRASANTAAHSNFVVLHPQYFSWAMHIVHIILLHKVSVVVYTIAERISLVMTFAHQAPTYVFIFRTNCPIQAWVVILFSNVCVSMCIRMRALLASQDSTCDDISVSLYSWSRFFTVCVSALGS